MYASDLNTIDDETHLIKCVDDKTYGTLLNAKISLEKDYSNAKRWS